jgi:hypothetical protein
MENPGADASCHLHIRRDGTTTRMVPDERRAWHAGESSWDDFDDVNDISLGWEIANRNDGQEPYTAPQYITVARLLRHYMPQGIAREDVVGHDRVARPRGRKNDPRGWDWGRMWALVGQLPSPSGVLSAGPFAAPEPPNLDFINVPQARHVRRLAAVRGINPVKLAEQLGMAEVIETMGRRVLRGADPDLKKFIDAIADFIKEQRGGSQR